MANRIPILTNHARGALTAMSYLPSPSFYHVDPITGECPIVEEYSRIRYSPPWDVASTYPFASATSARVPRAHLLVPPPKDLSCLACDDHTVTSDIDLQRQLREWERRFRSRSLPTVQEDIEDDEDELTGSLSGPTMPPATKYKYTTSRRTTDECGPLLDAPKLRTWLSEEDWQMQINVEPCTTLMSNALGVGNARGAAHPMAGLNLDVTADVDFGTTQHIDGAEETTGQDPSHRDSVATTAIQNINSTLKRKGSTIMNGERDQDQDLVADAVVGAALLGNCVQKPDNPWMDVSPAQAKYTTAMNGPNTSESDRDSKKLKVRHSVAPPSATTLVNVVSRTGKPRSLAHDLVFGFMGKLQHTPSPTSEGKPRLSVSWMDAASIAERADGPLKPKRARDCLSAVSWTVRRWWAAQRNLETMATWIGPTRPAAIMVDISVEKQ